MGPQHRVTQRFPWSRNALRGLLALTIVAATFQPISGAAQEPPASSKPPKSAPQKPPQLSADDAKQIAVCEASVTHAFHNVGDLAAVNAAIAQAGHALQIRLADQGESWWQTTDARLDLADLQRIATMNTAERASLAAALLITDPAPFSDLQNAAKGSKELDDLLTASHTEAEILGENHRWHGRALDLIGRVYTVQSQYSEAETAYRQALQIDQAALGQQHPSDATDLDDLASLYVAMGHNEQADGLYQQALRIEKETVGEDDPLYAATLCNLGDLYRYMGRYKQAEPLYQQSLSVRKQALGESHPDYARSLDRIAALYDSMGRYSEAEPLYKQAIAIRKQALGEQSADYARSVNNLALLYKEMARYKESEALYLQAMAIRKKVFGEQHRTYASSLDDLAQLYQAMGRYVESEQLYKQALEIRKKTLGEQHPAYAVNLDNLASLYEAMARYDEAETLSTKALEIRRQSVGEHHPGYAHNLVNLAQLYQTMGSYEQAEQLYQQALDIQKQVLGPSDLEYATTLDGLASLYVALGRNEQAEAFYQQALDIEKKAVGEQHPSYAATLCNLGDLYRLKAQFSQAEPLYVESLTIRKQAVGEQHPDYARSLDRLAALYDSTGRYPEAELLYKQAIEVRRQALGDQHPDYARSLNNLALLYKETKRYPEAEPLYVQALAIRKKVFGDQHRTCASSLDDLAQLYQAMKKYQQAEPLYVQALAIRKKALGEQHPAYAVNLDNLSLLYKAMQRYPEAEALSRQALAIRKKTVGEYHPQYATNLKHLAAILVVRGQTEEASQLLLESAQLQWLHLTENFPTMSDQQKRQFLARSHFSQTEELSSLVFQGKGNPKDGLQGVLLSKNLLFEVARQESGALASAVAAGSSQWQQQWQVRERLRHEYATVVLQIMAEGGRPPQAGHEAVDAEYVHSLATQIEQLDAQLRRTNPAYGAAARVQPVRLDDVTRALRPDEVLAEYVRYQPYDFVAWKKGNPRYGVFLLQGQSGQASAIDLGEADAIEAAVAKFRAEMRGSIDDFKTVEPSRGQIHRSEEQVAEASSALREIVWKPLEKQLSGIKRVYVAPDGQLSLIPFEALARKDDSGSWRYLTEDWELAYLGTGRDLSRLELSATPRALEAKTAILIGNPDFNAKPEELAALEAHTAPPSASAAAQSITPANVTTLGISGGDEARLEIPRNWVQVEVLATLIQQASAQLKQLGWSVTTMVDRAAVKESVEAVNAPRILQFATHGYILDHPNQDPQGWDNPLLRSMLIMAGVNGWHPVYRVGNEFLTEPQARAKGLNDDQLRDDRVELGDGVLTAYEVTGMRLQGTELVNLTACETGLGEVTPDGVAGLRQGFLLAGARSLTMSMWEVPAAETTQEIGDFYARWLGNAAGGQKPEHRYEAFHAAQLAALSRARDEHGAGHPFYWAGTIFVGDPGDLPPLAPASLSAKN